MAIINLTLQQSLTLIYNGKKATVNRFRYKYTSKFQWKCLYCGETIFVPYLAELVNSIYCDKYEACRSRKNRCYYQPNLVETHYFKRLKTEQYESISNNKVTDEK